MPQLMATVPSSGCGNAPSRYITNTRVNSAFHPTGVGKLFHSVTITSRLAKNISAAAKYFELVFFQLVAKNSVLIYCYATELWKRENGAFLLEHHVLLLRSL